MRIAFSLIFLALTSCNQLNSLTVDENENAFACVKGFAGLPWLSARGIMVDAGKTDVSNWTPEDWRTAFELCD